ncbi:DUF6789 family protein [Pseudobacteroides cellulosolvens]|uniref:DUF1440 domain-containing protein n=1 Tax=Pseudobacteroides cellulosolvens ATCC 35603 = DSM 2933 TaxID=398512 RepID=A0A0L6JPR3_9FIRM|nr:DUF6789 family protein [Pseudobacteroides cellulosolvens]KNY27367.1 hypothetical protein Bccel_2638 [Pseudobacteroides cellulosolvens ATCC 35603 = DSM 2933]
MKNDKFLMAGIIGTLSTLMAEIVTQICKILGFAEYSDYELSSLFVTANKPSWLMGLVVQGMVGSVVSILLYYLLKRVGHEHILIKSTVSGIVAWLGFEIIFGVLIKDNTFSIRPMSGYYSHLIGAIIFGLTVGILQKRYLFAERVMEQHS